MAALCVGSWVLAGQVASVVGAFGQAPAKPRAVAFTYAMDVQELPPGGGQVEVWVPLASNRAEQRILSREIRTSHRFTVGRDPDRFLISIFFYPHIELDGTVVSGSTTLELQFEELPQLQEGTT